MRNPKSWSYVPYDPVTCDALGNPGKPYDFLFKQVLPRDGGVRAAWHPMPGADGYRLYAVPYGQHPGGAGEISARCANPEGELDGLANEHDYELRVDALSGGEAMGRALPRWARPAPVPGTVVNYIHPDDYTLSYSGRSTASPGIVRLPNGELLVSHDVYWADTPQNLTQILSSKDDGASWQYVCDVLPCFWGKLFWHKDALYMIGCETECGALLVGRSDDYGRTFCAPIEIFPGGTRRTGGPMRSSLPVTEHAGRLWTSMDVGSHPLGYHDTVIVSAAVDADLMDPASWVCSAPLKFDPDWPGTSKGATRMGFLEGNIIAGPDGALYDILRYETRGGDPEYGLAGMVRIDPAHPEAAPTFERILKFDGNLSRFSIVRHERSGLYFASVSRVLDEPSYYRGRLSLMRSKDLIHWELARDLLDIHPICPQEWPTRTAFQYPDSFLEGDALYLVSRTAIFGAYNYHNANYITFHRFDLSGEVNEG